MRVRDLIDIYHLPPVSINLRLDKTNGNDPFFAKVVREYYAEARSRHSKLLFVEKYKYGFALCQLPDTFEAYFSKLESAARGNYRKALRLGYVMKRFDFNDQLDGIREIWQSTPVRQGTLPPEIREGRVRPITNPPSRTTCHDYPYFGVFKGEKLFAYAGCLVAGDLCNLCDFYGHDQYLNDGIVPLLIIEIARELYKSFPTVNIYSYGTYFGASESMRRFKRKFLFYPHKATWILGRAGASTAPGKQRLIYRMDISGPLVPKSLPEDTFVLAASVKDVAAHFLIWVRSWGWREAVKTSLKILSGKRIFFGVIREKKIVQRGWLNVGFCNHYPVERDSVVVGALETVPEHRGQGLATAAIQQGLVFLSHRGYRRFYIDTTIANQASRRMIEKAGFLEHVAG